MIRSGIYCLGLFMRKCFVCKGFCIFAVSGGHYSPQCGRKSGNGQCVHLWGILVWHSDIMRRPAQRSYTGADSEGRRSECLWDGDDFIIIAPVVGHIYPIFYGFRGGKGIARAKYLKEYIMAYFNIITDTAPDITKE